MKPHIKLVRAWEDSGWKYELWECKSSSWHVHKVVTVGRGATPIAAFMDWSAKP